MVTINSVLAKLVENARAAVASMEDQLVKADEQIEVIELTHKLMASLSPSYPTPESLQALLVVRAHRHSLAEKIDSARHHLALAETRLGTMASV